MKPTSMPRREAGRPRTHESSNRRCGTTLLATAVVVAAAIGVNLLQACSFDPNGLATPEDVYAVLDAAPFANPTVLERSTVVDDAKLKIERGWSCAHATHAASEEYVGMRIHELAELAPDWNGTVFLNGWDLEYDSKDHHVIGLGSAVFNIFQLGNILVWDAGGVLSDHNADDGYRWCYAYTLVSWPKPSFSPIVSPTLLPRVDIDVVHAGLTSALTFVDSGRGGALHTIKGQFTSALGAKAPRAVLPAGFGMSFTDNDHHILQIGFDYGTPKPRGKKIKWRSDAILKDNDSSRPHRTAELVSILRGDSVNLFHPQTALLESGTEPPGVRSNDLKLKPRSKQSCGAVVGDSPTETYDFAVTTPPFTWAMPLLTGWNVNQICGDEHVRRVAAWIDDYSYVHVSGDSHGTLRYRVRTALGDKDPFGFQDAVQVDVLGINLLLGPGIDPGTGPGGSPGPIADPGSGVIGGF